MLLTAGYRICLVCLSVCQAIILCLKYLKCGHLHKLLHGNKWTTLSRSYNIIHNVSLLRTEVHSNEWPGITTLDNSKCFLFYHTSVIRLAVVNGIVETIVFSDFNIRKGLVRPSVIIIHT